MVKEKTVVIEETSEGTAVSAGVRRPIDIVRSLRANFERCTRHFKEIEIWREALVDAEYDLSCISTTGLNTDDRFQNRTPIARDDAKGETKRLLQLAWEAEALIDSPSFMQLTLREIAKGLIRLDNSVWEE